MKTLSKQAIQQDIEELQKKLEEIHPNPYKYISRKDFTSLLMMGTRSVNNIQDLGIAIMTILATLNDGHTYLNPSCEVFGTNSFMFKFRFLNDGYYLIKSSETLSDYLGSKLVGINNYTINDIETLFSTLIPKENETSLRYYLPSKLMEPVILESLNIKKDKSIKLQLEKDERQVSINIEPEDCKSKMVSIFEKIPNIVNTLTVQDTYWFEEIANLNAFYFQFNECFEKEDLTINEVVKAFEKSNLSNIIIDLRNNTGGDSDVLNPLKKFLKKYKNKYKVIVLTSADTYSSAIINLLELSNLPNTISVGEVPHGNPTHYGEVESFILPNSQLKIFTSSKIFKFKGYKLGETFKPTYIVLTRIQNLIHGKDTQMEYLSKIV
jgi:hypothetical protein